MKQQQNNKAFTIIEVVLVLAVAGLIFLVVFAAIPRLQASRRDNQRKRDAEALYTLVLEYKSNTGAAPAQSDVIDAFATTPVTTSPFYSYIENEELEDPSGGSYVHSNNSPSTFSEGTFRYQVGTWGACSLTGDSVVSGNSSTSYAVLMKLERGYYCLDNS